MVFYNGSRVFSQPNPRATKAVAAERLRAYRMAYKWHQAAPDDTDRRSGTKVTCRLLIRLELELTILNK